MRANLRILCCVLAVSAWFVLSVARGADEDEDVKRAAPTYLADMQRTGHFPGELRLQGKALLFVDSTITASTGDDGWLYAINPKDGSVAWKWQASTLGGGIWHSPVCLAGNIYFGSGDGFIAAVKSKDGTELWRAETKGAPAESPVIAHGRAYGGTHGGFFSAWDFKTGELVWEFEAGGIMSSPTVHGETVYLGTDQFLYAIKAADGEVEWKLECPGCEFSCPAVDGNALYIAQHNGKLNRVDLAKREVVWAVDLEQENMFISPALGKDTLYVTAKQTTLRAIAAKDGATLWSFETGGSLPRNACVLEKSVCIGARDGFFYEIDAITGKQRWKQQLGEPVEYGGPSPCCSAGDKVYIGYDRMLFALDLKKQKVAWSVELPGVIRGAPVLAD